MIPVSAVIEDISYGEHDSNVLDFYAPLISSPGHRWPLILFVHGGGWLDGDENININAEPWKSFRRAGYAIASIRYRLADEAQFPDNPKDVGRAIQYLRYTSDQLNLNTNYFIGFGNSAGSNMLGYLAFSDDLADSGSMDPVEQESSKIAAWINQNGPTDWTLMNPLFVRGDYWGEEDLTTVPQEQILNASPLWHLINNNNPIPVYSTYTTSVNIPPLQDVHDAYFGRVLEGHVTPNSAFYYNNAGNDPQLMIRWLWKLGIQ